MKKKIKKINEIEDILFEKSRRAKRINISIKPWRGIRVAVPRGVSFKQAEAVFLKKLDWVREKLALIKEVEQKRPLYGLSGEIKTNQHNIKIVQNGNENIAIEQFDDRVNLYLPKNEDMKSKRIQRKLRTLLVEIYRIEAKNYLPARVEMLANKYKFRYNRVYIKFQKTLWGSCSGKLNINLNLNLMRLDKGLRDYVILHELLHTRIRDHSSKFWHELSKYVAQPRQKDSALKKYNLRYYIP
ncbi:MAG: M48 family metallopeptidase [Candidatus Marinimicrobia bacterium]|nr:M48 family metallopeptidase [Candidatus Neomarinimicrobiota bacterium]